MRKISDDLDLEPATVSPLRHRLESAGFISRRRVAGDEQSLVVEPTAAGAAISEEALSVPEAMRKLRLEREDGAQLHKAMTRRIVTAHG